MDVFSRHERSRIMAGIKGKNTRPEIIVRSLLHRMGYRFRLHRTDLPGKPDIVLPRHRKIIFVHGCFWHGHKGCPKSKRPQTNRKFWNRKLDGNIRRDAETLSDLRKLGWNVLIVWECEVKDVELMEEKLKSFMTGDLCGQGAESNGRNETTA